MSTRVYNATTIRTYQTGEHLHRSLLIETDDLIQRKLETKVRCQAHQRIAITLQRVEETGAWLVHGRISNAGKDLAICSLVAATMRCSEKEYSHRLFTDIIV